jgi:tetratricopeptide (TPR) repeat protein
MTGWLILVAIGAAALGLLWLFGFARGLWSFAGAALMLGAAGYALQGRPALPGAPVAGAKRAIEVDPDYVELRKALFGEFTYANSFFVAADAMTRAGETGAAVSMMLAGLQGAPDNLPLWTGLGVAYAEHDGNQISPAATFAFNRAIRLNPRHPGPWFMLGLAHIRGGQFAAARPYWRRALALSPEGAPYREMILTRVMLLDRFLEAQAAAPR